MMSTPSNPQVAAGWYPDPAGSARSRWWDGTQWTEHFTEPYAPAAEQLTAPAGTNPNTVWIWLVVVLPYLTFPVIFFYNPFGWMQATMSMTTAAEAQAALLTFMLPVMVISVAGLVLTGLTIFFAYKDWSELKARGVPQPFHWAFVFLNLAVGPVYAIGRAIVAKRRTGRGLSVMWVSIILLVVATVVAIVWVTVVMTEWITYVAQYAQYMG